MRWVPPFVQGVPAAVQQVFIALSKHLQTLAPVGAIHAFGGSLAPDGYLLCNGAAVSRTVYADLYAAIGVTWGAGDGTTTFNVPSLTNRFLQGAAAPGGLGGSSTHSHGVLVYVTAGAASGADNTNQSHLPPYANVLFIIKA